VKFWLLTQLNHALIHKYGMELKIKQLNVLLI